MPRAPSLAPRRPFVGQRAHTQARGQQRPERLPAIVASGRKDSKVTLPPDRRLVCGLCCDLLAVVVRPQRGHTCSFPVAGGASRRDSAVSGKQGY